MVRRLFVLFFFFSFVIYTPPIFSTALDEEHGFSRDPVFKRLVDLSTTYHSRLSDDYDKHSSFIQCLGEEKELGEFRNWMTQSSRPISRKEKIQCAHRVLGSIQNNLSAVQVYHSWIIHCYEGHIPLEELFERLLVVYLKRSRNRVLGLSKGESIPPTHKDLSKLCFYGQYSAQQSIDGFALQYLLLEGIYEAIDPDCLSENAKNMLRCAPVLLSLLNKKNKENGPNPDLSLLDGAMYEKGYYKQKHKPLPGPFTFRALRQNFRGAYDLLNTVCSSQVVVTPGHEIHLYAIRDLLPAYKSLRESFLEEKEDEKGGQNKKLKKKKKKRKKKNKNKKIKKANQDKIVPKEEEEGLLPVQKKPLEEAQPNRDETKFGAHVQQEMTVQESQGRSNKGKENIRLKKAPSKNKPKEPILFAHKRKSDLWQRFMTEKSFPYSKFTNLFTGAGGIIKQTRGGSSHVKLMYRSPDGEMHISGTWRPHPTPTFYGRSLKKLRAFLVECGFENLFQVMASRSEGRFL